MHSITFTLKLLIETEISKLKNLYRKILLFQEVDVISVCVCYVCAQCLKD